MTDNEKLIEEARLAFVEAWEEENARTTFNSAARSEHSRSRAGIRAALAVFEKAHTPTVHEVATDEREAILLAQEVRAWADSREGWSQYQHDLGMRVVKILNGLLAGRSEVPEPSTECPHPCVHLSQEDVR